MALAAKAVMLAWSNKPEAARPAYYAWHNRHMTGHIALPGFLRGRRFIAIDADRDFLTWYEVEDIAVLSSKAYRDRVDNPSAETRQTTKVITSSVRTQAVVELSLGIGQGGFVQSLRFDAAPERADELKKYICDVALPKLVDMPNIVGAHLCITDMAASSYISVERSDRQTDIPNWVIVTEGVTREALDHAATETLAESMLTAHGAAGPMVRGTYRNEITISKGN